MCVAAKSSWLNGMYKLTEYNADLLNIQMPDGNYPLHYIAKKEYWNLQYILSCMRPDLNVQSQDGSTVLHQVIRDRNHSLKDTIIMVKMLVEAGVDKTIQDNAGFTAFHYGSSNSYWETFVPLLSA